MTQREEFEKWHEKAYPGLMPVPMLFAAWQASRAVALEAVAKIIEEHKEYRAGFIDNGIEDEISALKVKP